MTTVPEHELSTGAQPAPNLDERAAAASVQQMFDDIAPSYDTLNHVLSASIDRLWWWRAARCFREILQQPEAVVADLCCGTGDMTLALYRHRPAQARAILAMDFSHRMLSRGAAKFAGHKIVPIEADALHLPLADASIDLATYAFGFRNLANYEDGLAELFRVLKPGGQLGILECNQPDGIVRLGYNLYFKHLLPRVGGLLSGDARAYSYLPASVERFPRAPRMKQMLAAAGFTDISWTSYTFGIAGLYMATKPCTIPA
jgi:demethylmenaquinone methyltransferase/2-methoxy-6-polyprenyl-1,4-benzoquinol methylase